MIIKYLIDIIFFMSHPKYEDDPKLCNLVQYCMKKRWNYNESKEFLKNNGYTLSAKQFQRIKKRIFDSNRIKVKDISQTAHTQFTLDVLDQYCLMKNNLFEHFKNTDDFWEKKACTEAILKIDEQISRIYDSSDVVGNISF